MVQKKYKRTVYACFIGYIVQAIVNNYAPLLFVTFQKTYSIPLSKITMLITINFFIQLLADGMSAVITKKLGYKKTFIFSHAICIVGFVLMTILPDMMSDPFVGLLISCAIYAVGGGIIEVVVSPTVENCPSDNKERMMSLLHSFYCWGHMGVVLLSTLFFVTAGIENWKILAYLWALVPLGNIVLICFSPIENIDENIEKKMSLGEILKSKLFWIFAIMIFAGACGEQSISQWVSSFTELGLGVSKTMGDMLGTAGFALFMGLTRVVFAKFGEKIDLYKYCCFSACLCIFCYISLGVIPNPIFNLICCCLCGFSVGIFWPATYSKAAASLKNGGTLVFSLLAIAGDLGCGLGPSIAGAVSSAAGNNMKAGMFISFIFPLVFLITVLVMMKDEKKTKKLS